MTSSPSFDEIPTIDLSLANDASTLPRLLDSLRYALTEVGFLYVANHGVRAAAIDDLASALPGLFALDDAAKCAVALENSPHFLGYSGLGSETTAGRADRREQFEFATELPATWREGLPLCERLRGPNQWPENNINLRNVVETYICELSRLGERFLELVARALDMPAADAFRPFLSDQHRLKLVRYPPPSPSPSSPPTASKGDDNDNDNDNDSQGVGPHKDSSGWWTFLLQASPPEVGGLQVLNRAGAWVDVPAVPGTLVVNIGQAFEAVTGGLCPATTHRVVLLPGGSAPAPRYSVPFFQGVRRDLTRREAAATAEVVRARLRGEDGVGSGGGGGGGKGESDEARKIDAAFLKGGYDTWGEAQLRTKIRSHRANGRRFYPEVYERYVNDDLV
ncbi:hypothetical protein F5X99DRAFT_430525 [Biscogniauxia marginata]|nr:hypothetical protein F5X99DRAFT_430525 [Biscogniauxia marginata]